MEQNFTNEKINSNVEVSEIDLVELFSIFLKNKWKICISGILGAIIFAIVSITCITPQYQSSVTFYVSSDEATGSASSTYNDVMLSQLMVSTYMQLFVSNRVVSEIVSETGLGYTSAQVLQMISVSQVGETEIIALTVTCSNPEHSYLIAKTFEDYAGNVISTIDDKREIKVIDGVPGIPVQPSSPNLKLNIVLGLAVGLALCYGFLIVINFVNGRIRSTEDLKKIVDAPVLGIIPTIE